MVFSMPGILRIGFWGAERFFRHIPLVVSEGRRYLMESGETYIYYYVQVTMGDWVECCIG